MTGHRPLMGVRVKDGLDGFLADIPLGRSQKAFAVCSWGGGWDHVSVSYPDRCPTWQEMCRAKDLFFGPDERVVQFHPPDSEHVNVASTCLHLWRWQGGEFPHPPHEFVGGLTPEDTEKLAVGTMYEGMAAGR